MPDYANYTTLRKSIPFTVKVMVSFIDTGRKSYKVLLEYLSLPLEGRKLVASTTFVHKLSSKDPRVMDMALI